MAFSARTAIPLAPDVTRYCIGPAGILWKQKRNTEPFDLVNGDLHEKMWTDTRPADIIEGDTLDGQSQQVPCRHDPPTHLCIMHWRQVCYLSH